MKFRNIEDVASLLDEHIEKGLKRSKIEQLEEKIEKGLTFDPTRPHEMHGDSPYYNPYKMLQDGSFAPYPVDYWAEQGKNPDGYNTVRAFYNVVGDRPQGGEAMTRFRGFAKSVEDYVIKGAAVPIGTVHTFKDGQQYKKVSEGNWQVVAGRENRRWGDFLNDKRPEVKTQANNELESHAQKTQKIKEALSNKEREEKVVGRAKNEAMQAAIAHTKGAMSHLYDGKPPKAVEAHHDEAMKQYQTEAPKHPVEKLQAAGQQLQPKTHHVAIDFEHQGQKYSHKFENVEAQHHAEAIQKVQELLKQKLPGAQIHKIHAETVRPEKPAAEKGQE